MLKSKKPKVPPPEEFPAGWVGFRYLLCDDGAWHLVLEMGEDRRADTQCCADVKLAENPTATSGSHPMCAGCTKLQAARWDKKPTAKGHSY